MSSGYELGARVGEGAFGCVYAATRLADSRKVAVKRHYASNDPAGGVRVDALRELRAASELAHPNVLALLHAYLDGSGSVHTVMDLMDGSLETIIDSAVPIEQVTEEAQGGSLGLTRFAASAASAI